MNMAYTVRVEEAPNAADAALVREGLYQYNLTYGGEDHYQEGGILLRDEAGSVVGGLLGCTYWGYLNIQELWIAENHRNRGQGKALLDAAEQEAIGHGCRYAYLDTHSFQASSFYLNKGYISVGELEDLPPGHSKYLLWKVLRYSTVEMDASMRFY